MGSEELREALVAIQSNAFDANDECRYCGAEYEDGGHRDGCPHTVATLALTAALPKRSRIDWSDVVVDEGDEAP
jgi:hypothetical protein